MPRNGSGTHSLPAGNPVSSGTTIEASWANTTLSDISAALTASIAKDGQTPATADLPMGNNRHTGVAAATARTHYAQAAQVQDGAYHLIGSVAGTDTITGSLSPTPTAYASGMRVVLIPANTNTGAATLGLNGITARDIVTVLGLDIVAGDIVAGIPALLIYDLANTRWVLLNPVSIARAARPHAIITSTDSPYTAVAGERIMVDKSGGNVVVNLPASPAVTDQPIGITHIAGATNTLTIGRNTNNIMALAEDLVIDDNYASIKLAYAGATPGWRLTIDG